MTSLELLKEIEAWLCFNTEPSKEETAKLRKSINDHVTEQLNLHNVSQQRELLLAFTKYWNLNYNSLPEGINAEEVDSFIKANNCG